MEGSRRWSIIWAHDFSLHLSPQVFRLCWFRCYVCMTHGGGVTPVTQTVDTDLNQSVKREYIAVETNELLAQMLDGVSVPRCRPEDCIDMMHKVLINMTLHLQGAEGYLKTGMTVALDNSQDDLAPFGGSSECARTSIPQLRKSKRKLRQAAWVGMLRTSSA